MLVDVMKRHLAEFPAEDEGLIFRGALGAPLRRNNFHRSVRWQKALRGRVFRPDSTSTIYATPATTWRRQAAPAPMARCIDGKAGHRLLADQRHMRTRLAERGLWLPTAEDRGYRSRRRGATARTRG